MDIIETLGIVAVPAITVIVFLIVQAVKATPLDTKWMPVIAGFCGGALGIAASFLMPDFPSADPITAVAIGIVSGLAATGAHQIYKQLFDKTSGGGDADHPPDETTTYSGKHENGTSTTSVSLEDLFDDIGG